MHFFDSSSYNPALQPNPKLNKIWPAFTHLYKFVGSSNMPECDINADEILL